MRWVRQIGFGLSLAGLAAGCTDELPEVAGDPTPTAPTSATAATVPLDASPAPDAAGGDLADGSGADVILADASGDAPDTDPTDACLAATQSERACDDGVDNDCDGNADLDDSDCWWDRAWTRRVEVSLDNSGGGELIDFPVVLRLGAAGAPVDWGNADSSGADVRIVGQDGTVYSHEVERWEEGSSRAWVWTRIPLVAGDAVTRFHLYYGNADATDTQDAPAVWSNGYMAVWHFPEGVSNGETGGIHADSTGNGNSAVQQRTDDNRADARPGVLGACADVEGGDEHIVVTTAGSNFETVSSPLTIEMRAFSDTDSGSTYMRAVSAGPSGQRYRIAWAQPEVAWATSVKLDATDQVYVGTDAGDPNVWQHVASSYDGAELSLYVDGGSVASAPADTALPPETDLFIGNRPDLQRGFDGCVDELRLANVTRSTGWHVATSRNFAGTLLSYGSEEVLP